MPGEPHTNAAQALGALDCAESVALIGPFVDRELSTEDAGDLSAHLASCGACAVQLKNAEGLKAAVRRAGSIAAPAALRARLQSALAEAKPPVRARRFALTRWSFDRLDPRGVAVGAAALGMAAWFALGGLSHPVVDKLLRQSALHTVIDDGVTLHARGLPLDYAASDASLVQQWVEGKLHFGVRVPQFAQEKAGPRPTLMGARLSTLHNHPAAMVTYTVPAQGGRRVSLLVVDDPEPELTGNSRHVEGRDVVVSRAHGYNVVSWRSDEIVYSLISDLDESDVLAMVQAAEQR
jgi:anti-sigma factor RsiW